MRKLLASIAAAGILVVGAIAVTGVTASGVSAQEADETTTEAPQARLSKALGELVTDGVITQDQADAVAAKLQESFGDAQPFRRGFAHGFRFANGLDTLSEVLGITADDLGAQLREGATVAELAGANGVDVQAVIDALVADAESRLSAAVESGRIDQATADERLAELETRITAMVNGDFERPFDGRRPGADGFTDEGTGLGA
jgi:hypothetical protein